MKGDHAVFDVGSIGHITQIRRHEATLKCWKDGMYSAKPRGAVHQKKGNKKESPTRNAILAHLAIEDATAPEIQHRCGLTRGSIDAMLSQMVIEKQIVPKGTKPCGARSARLYSLVKP